MFDDYRLESALEDMVLTLLDTRSVNESAVLDTVSSLGAQFYKSLSSDTYQRISDRLLERLSVELELGVAVVGDGHEPWLRERKQNIKWKRWGAYRKLLMKQRRPLKVLDKLGETTDDILDLAGDPLATGSWQRRGLVIGEVQSGKTSTYIGLLDKAADAGFKLFILLGGHTESLRRQTQARVDEGFVGRDSAFMSKELRHLVDSKLVGVGQIDPSIRAYGFTTISSDFSIRSAESLNFEISHDMSEPVVLVVKKNKKILENLHKWLKEQAPAGGHRMPLMLLDDEADYASINTNDGDTPTAINKAIRDLLELSQRSSYVAFTATPFANVLIDDADAGDLFPKDYIYSLESPSNYIGADVIFGDDANDEVLSFPDDAEDIFPFQHRSPLRVDTLPNSLTHAIATFIVANAIRDVRGHIDEPRSMLINVSRFNSVQQQVHLLVEDVLARFRNAIEFEDDETETATLSDLKDAYSKEYSSTGVTWEQVRKGLPSAVTAMSAILVNSKSNSADAYSSLSSVGRSRIIAVGGAVLSRGLTLNGLMTSYFYQRSRASDTLMQMGRWFGYREGYGDLVRIWIDEEVASWYSFVADSVRELREDLREMHSLGMTPKDFGLKVRKHPESLLVTAANKSRSAELVERTVSLRDKTLESARLLDSETQSTINYVAARALISENLALAQENGTPANRIVLRNVSKSRIAEFFNSFGSHPSDPYFSGTDQAGVGSPFARYVNTAIDSDLKGWDILVMGGGLDAVERFGKFAVHQVERKIKASGGSLLVSGARRRVAGSSDIGGLLTDHERADLRAQRPAGQSISERQYRSNLHRPALLVYFIQYDSSSIDGKHVKRVASAPLVALKVAYPADPAGLINETRNGTGPKYLINSVMRRAWVPELGMDLSDDDIGDLDE